MPTELNMERLKRSRKPIQVGDVFAYKMKDRPYGFGRVIRDEILMGNFTDVIMIYIYDAFSDYINSVPNLDKKRLLLPPILTSQRPWTTGYFVTVGNKPLLATDVLSTHCFKDLASKFPYCDEYRQPLSNHVEPCGLYALDNHVTIDAQISTALGLPVVD